MSRSCSTTSGSPIPRPIPGLETWRAGVATLARLPHAHVKLSALSMLANPRRVDPVRSVIAHLLELFGPRRCMFGSNFPVEALAGDFASLFELFLEALGDLSAADRDEVLSGTARRFYRL